MFLSKHDICNCNLILLGVSVVVQKSILLRVCFDLVLFKLQRHMTQLFIFSVNKSRPHK